MTIRRNPGSETAEWPVASPRAAALVSPQVVTQVVRRLENALSVLELAPRLGARARGVARALERAD